MAASRSLFCFSLLLLGALYPAPAAANAATLSETYYDYTCPQVTTIVSEEVDKVLATDKTLAGAFNRLQFHDCWVRGCDGSILLNSTADSPAEIEGFGNFEIRGIPQIDVIKEAIETVCPGVVSCADIIALAAHDATVKVGGPSWPVYLGRRDGNVSLADDANTNLPFPVLNFDLLVDNFGRKGFNAREMIVLSGAHTIGRTTCNGVGPHIYNFTGSDNVNDTDPTLDVKFADMLKKLCPKGNRNNTMFLDSTATRFDHLYYKSVITNKGVFITDSALITNSTGKTIVGEFATRGSTWFKEFSAAMVKMGNLEPLTGSAGEIRKTCQFIN